jgi:hypothetical protein
MRVGFVTPLLWDRFGPPWAALVRDLGAEVVLAAPDEVVAGLDDPRVAALPALAPRLALASAVACGAVDLLIVPELLVPRDGGIGSSQDPWIADLPTMIARSLPGGPAVVAVPGERGPRVPPLVMTVAMRINRDAGVVRRAWERRRRELETPPSGPSASGPSISGRAASGQTASGKAASGLAAPSDGPRVALVGPPWWLTPATLALAGRGAGRLVGQFQLAAEEARGEGRRMRPELADADAEVIGSARRFARQADVDVVRLVLDAESPTAPWLERRVREAAPRGIEVVTVAELADAATWARALTPPDRRV